MAESIAPSRLSAALQSAVDAARHQQLMGVLPDLPLGKQKHILFCSQLIMASTLTNCIA